MAQRDVSIVLVDDDHLVRGLLQRFLERIEGFTISGEAATAFDALRLIEQVLPDVAVVDIILSGASGIGLAAQLHQRCPNVHVLILTGSTDGEHLVGSLRAGVAGYLVKNSSVAELEFAIRAVAEGHAYLTPRMCKQFLADNLDHIQYPPADPLTLRQREVLELIVAGKTNKEVANQLKLSVKTVEKHRTQLMERIGVHNTAGLVRYAIQHGVAG
jgi:DNA-binding NarL/FixJ family response regulator